MNMVAVKCDGEDGDGYGDGEEYGCDRDGGGGDG